MKHFGKAFMVLMLISVVSCKKHSGRMIIESPWISEVPPASEVAGGYFTLKNDTGTDDKLLSIAGDISDNIEIHKMVMEDGVMRMDMLKFLEIKNGDEYVFEPGALHVMFIGLQKELTEGKSYQLNLQFEKAGNIEVTFPVKKMEY